MVTTFSTFFVLITALNGAVASTRRQCVDVLCRTVGPSADGAALLLSADGRTLDECRACQQCTDNDYSVCTMPKRYDRNLHKFLWSRGCECAHAVPRGCEVVGSQRGDLTVQLAADGRQLYEICYFSKIRKPAGLHAVNTRNMVLVTLKPFWLDEYWHGLRPANLTFHYEFIVQDFRHCHDKLTLLSVADADQLLDDEERALWDQARNTSAGPTAATAGGPWTEPFLCASSLRIEMHDYSGRPEGKSDRSSYDDNNNVDYNGEETGKTSTVNKRIVNETDVESDEIYGDDYSSTDDAYHDVFQPPSIKFERAIFVDAHRVRFFYKFDVRRPRQLFMLQFQKKRVAALGSKRTSVMSEMTIFELQPNIFGYGDLDNTTIASPVDDTRPPLTADTSLYTNYQSLTSLLTTAFAVTTLTSIVTNPNFTAANTTTMSAPAVDTNIRWCFFLNAFLLSMLASAVLLLVLIHVYRRQRWPCGDFCFGGGGAEEKTPTVENGCAPAERKRPKKKKRIFRGNSYQST